MQGADCERDRALITKGASNAARNEAWGKAARPESALFSKRLFRRSNLSDDSAIFQDRAQLARTHEIRWGASRFLGPTKQDPTLGHRERDEQQERAAHEPMFDLHMILSRGAAAM